MPVITRLRRRSEFLRAARGKKHVGIPLVLQSVERRDRCGNRAGDETGVGFTATKRLGNAVERNRAKRRMREAARLVMPGLAEPGNDFVLIARGAILTCRFDQITTALEEGLRRLQRSR